MDQHPEPIVDIDHLCFELSSCLNTVKYFFRFCVKSILSNPWVILSGLKPHAAQGVFCCLGGLILLMSRWYPIFSFLITDDSSHCAS